MNKISKLKKEILILPLKKENSEQEFEIKKRNSYPPLLLLNKENSEQDVEIKKRNSPPPFK